MAQKQAAPAFFMVALLVFAATTPTAYGQLGPLVGNLLQQVVMNVTGAVCCSPTGNCNGTTAGISGVPVSLICTTGVGNATVNVGNGVTNVNGTFIFTVFNILRLLGITLTNLLNGNPPCATIVTLPLNQTVCSLLNAANGTLVGALGFVNTTVSPTLGQVENFLAQTFVNVAANVTVS